MPVQKNRTKGSKRSNGRLAAIFGLGALTMVGVAFASVPAYRLFCQVTGYGGTPQIEEAGAEAVPISSTTITVRFDSSVNQAIPWRFVPVQRSVDIHLGEHGLAFYEATNLSDETIVGTATFNVTPLKAAQYFTKIECFCFTEQTLKPGETVQMPVTFYVDPALAEDPHVSEVTALTLSYTFFRKNAEQATRPAVPLQPGNGPS